MSTCESRTATFVYESPVSKMGPTSVGGGWRKDAEKGAKQVSGLVDCISSSGALPLLGKERASSLPDHDEQ